MTPKIPLCNTADEIHSSSSSSSSSSSKQSEPNSNPSSPVVPFGRPMRELFCFNPAYKPFNHGSFGTFPKAVQEARFEALRKWEEAECISQVYSYPAALLASRKLIAPLLGAALDEVVLLPNATTGVNTVLRNLVYEEGDVIVFPETIYSACRGTVEQLEESTAVKGHAIDVGYPIEDDELVELFRETVVRLASEGRRVRVAVFDCIVSAPGVRVPWERIVAACRELRVLSLIDAAHGIGHVDLRHVGALKPDFLVTNCHKWLYVPRGCAALYVPFANQHFITTALPTSHGYLPAAARTAIPTSIYFTRLFQLGATVDLTTYLAIPAAIRFREEVCGGEAAIMEYCARLAREGGDLVAATLGTDVLDNKRGSLRRGTAFANVRLPIHVVADIGDGNGQGVSRKDVETVINWFKETAVREFGTYLQTMFFQGTIYVRLSGQVYLEMADFEWAAGKIGELCERVNKGEWGGLEPAVGARFRPELGLPQ